jgi:hypothetical protein
MAFLPSGVPLRGTKKAAINHKIEKPSHLQNKGEQIVEQTRTSPLQSKRGKRSNEVVGARMPPVYVPPKLRGDKESSSSSGSEDFAGPVSRTVFYDDSKGSPVTFSESIPNTVHTQQLESPRANPTVWISKLMFNMACFHRDTPPVSGYVDRQYEIIFQQMSRDVIKTIRSKVVDQWTFINFFAAMQASIEALEMFYTLDSIQSYSGSDTNRDKNAANITMQRILETDTNILFLKDDLRRMLKGVWCPPQLASLIRWTYQLYKTADLDQATNYRFLPFKEFVKIYDYDVSVELSAKITVILTNLNNNNNTKIWSICSQVWPEGEIIGLPLSCATAVYDPRHYEIFCNQPVMATIADGSVIVTPYADNPDFEGSFIYGINQQLSEASGLGFVMQTLYASQTGAPVIDFFRTFRFSQPGNDYKFDTNKFSLLDNSYFRPRTWTETYVTNESADVHLIRQDITDLSVISRKSSIPSGFQPVYFDIVTAPLINLRDFMSNMFGLR